MEKVATSSESLLYASCIFCDHNLELKREAQITMVLIKLG